MVALILLQYNIKTRTFMLEHCVCAVPCHFITCLNLCNHHKIFFMLSFYYCTLPSLPILKYITPGNHYFITHYINGTMNLWDWFYSLSIMPSRFKLSHVIEKKIGKENWWNREKKLTNSELWLGTLNPYFINWWNNQTENQLEYRGIQTQHHQK